MENAQRTVGWRLRGLACAGAGALLVAGCGSGSDYKNNPRPPAPINVTAFISAKRVSVSPAKFGAGPIVVIVANQSNASQEVTFQNATGTVRQTALVDPGTPGTLKLNVEQGNYQVKVGSQDIKPATVTVGAKRPSAQNQLLQP
ncbi:MAG: hypothetical protein M3155_06725 [Actinomycetota bacterium]|nr:hypothetical protein [Actinomycetota bacterium]